jgi:hypothetical protein
VVSFPQLGRGLFFCLSPLNFPNLLKFMTVDVENVPFLVFLHSGRWLLVTASAVPSSQILVTLMKDALSSSETPVLTRATRYNIPEDAILHSYHRENLKTLHSILTSTNLKKTKYFLQEGSGYYEC